MSILAATLPLAIIHIDGVDAEKFLQSQLSCDVAAVTETTPQLSAYCNPKGYVESLLWLSRTDSGFRALLPSSLADNTLALFKKYGAFAKVQLSVLPAQAFELTVQTQEQLLQWQANHLSLGAPLSEFVTNQPTQANQWRAYWLAAGVPLLDSATQGLFRPHDLNLPELGAICFTKGCYPGQEIVARMHYRGKPKVHLQRLCLSTEGPLPTPGTVLTLHDQSTLTIIDALWLNAHHVALTAVLSDALYQALPSQIATTGETLTPWTVVHD